MQNQNLFALLPDDADDVSYAIPSPIHAVAVAATPDPKKGSAGQKKKPINQSSDGSDPNDKRFNHPRPVNRRDVVINKSKAELQGQAPKDTDRVGYQQRSVGSNVYRSANVGSNGGGANGNYKGNSFQKNYNRPNTNQDSYGAGDSVPSRGRGGERDYGGRGGRGRGRNSSGDQVFNEYSNGSQPRRGNGRGFQSHPESQGLKFESSKVQNNSQTEMKDIAGDENEGWQVVSRRKQGSAANSEVRSEVSHNSEAKDDQIDGIGWRSNGVVNGQPGHYNRGNGTYYNENTTKSVASNNSEMKEDIGEVVEADNGDSINVNSVGEDISAEDEERRKRHEIWLKEKEEDEKKKTLKQYEEERKKNQKSVALREPRIVDFDKELEAMQPVGKKKDLVLPLNLKDGSESNSVADVSSNKNKEKKETTSPDDDVCKSSSKNKEKKKETTSPDDEDICKSIVQGFMETASYQRPRYNRRADEGSYRNGYGFSNKGSNVGEGSYPKGNVAKGFSDKGYAVAKGISDPVEGSYRKGSAATDKGNTFEGKVPKEKGVEMKNDSSKGGKSAVVKTKEIVINMKFDDHAQFPALK